MSIVCRSPKSARSRRQVKIPESLTSQLREYKDILQTERAALGGIPEDSDFVFCHVNGNPRDERSVQRGFDRVLRVAGLPHIRFHDPRYTHALLLLRAGVHPKAVSESLGHGSMSFTLDGYSHLISGLQEAAATRLEALLGGIL